MIWLWIVLMILAVIVGVGIHRYREAMRYFRESERPHPPTLYEKRVEAGGNGDLEA